MAAHSLSDEVRRTEDKESYGGEKLEHDVSAHDVCSETDVVVDLVWFSLLFFSLGFGLFLFLKLSSLSLLLPLAAPPALRTALSILVVTLDEAHPITSSISASLLFVLDTAPTKPN